MKKLSILITTLLIFCMTSQSQTFISGNISGSWETTGSPYIVTDDCTIPNGQVLTINPGVEVIIGDSLNFNIHGTIIAEGTLDEPISFSSPNESLFFNRIYVYYRKGNDISKFNYCKISNAYTGVYLHMQGQKNHGGNETMYTEITNCHFKSCLNNGIYGNSEGETICEWPPGPTKFHAHLNPIIRNCVFEATANGITLKIHGDRHTCGGNQAYSSFGYTSPQIQNNVFKNLTQTALDLTLGSYAADSYPVFINNTLIDCYKGISTKTPYDVEIKNNIIYNSTIGIEKLGDLSNQVVYNCFYNTDTLFIGYTTSYGDTIWQNNNGIPSDLLYNIYRNPSFVDTIHYYLKDIVSPCIDAGDDSTSYNDICFPPSLGLVTNDIGITGGPYVNCIMTGLYNNQKVITNKLIIINTYPNPFSSSFTIEYKISHFENVKITFYNQFGKDVDIIERSQSKGLNRVIWSPENLPAGVYYFRLQAGEQLASGKMLLINPGQ